jgi:carboxyl-terminal processing protease
MRKFPGLYFLVTALLTSIAFAQDADTAVNIVGIGVAIEKVSNGTARIKALIPNAPAERAGLAADDHIIEVKSLPSSPTLDVRPLTLKEIVDLIRGPVEAPIEISFIRGHSDPIVISINREILEVEDTE